MAADPRHAITEHREHVAAEPRPVVLDLSDQVEDADLRELWRLYRWEWVVVYQVAAHPSEERTPNLRASVKEQAVQHYRDLYEGRVEPLGVRFLEGGSAKRPSVKLMLRMPVMRGEFKYRRLAVAHAQERGWVSIADIVERGSEAEHRLINYGIRRLPQVQT